MFFEQGPTSPDHKDEFFYLLQTAFEQAKSRAWNIATCETKKRLREISDTYDVSTAMIIDGLKRDVAVSSHFESDMQLVAKVSSNKLSVIRQ